MSFQQSFAKASEFLVKIGKADQADFYFMKEMKSRRDRFSTEALNKIKEYTELELRYLAHMITELRQILHDIRLNCAPDIKPIHISNWYGPGAIASAILKNLDIIKNHYGQRVKALDPSPVQIAAHHAFSAGNIQLMKVGHARDLLLHRPFGDLITRLEKERNEKMPEHVKEIFRQSLVDPSGSQVLVSKAPLVTVFSSGF